MFHITYLLTILISTLIAFLGILAAITLLIGVHEAGHFFAAKAIGVKVLRFSLGFGKPLWRRYDKSGTEYVIAVFPLGGYVKLLEDAQQQIPVSEQAFAFNRQALWARFLVVAAGPLFNILLAILVYWIAFCLGIKTVIPVVGSIEPHSIAASAGLQPGQEITSVDQQVTLDWQQVTMGIVRHLGVRDTLTMTVKPFPFTPLATTAAATHIVPTSISLNLNQWIVSDLRPELLKSLGIKEYKPTQPVIISKVIAHGPADLAGIRAGDQLLMMNNTLVTDWGFANDFIKQHPQQMIQIKIKRQQTEQIIPVKLDRTFWIIGAGYMGIEAQAVSWPQSLLRLQQYSLIEAINPAIQQVGLLMNFNLLVLKKILTGAISIKSLGGPISLFKGAAMSAQYGIVPYLLFLGFISIGLAIINLLPIPGLDGSHLFYFIWEGLVRRPVSQAVQMFMLRMGVILLVILMIQTIVNDIMRW